MLFLCRFVLLLLSWCLKLISSVGMWLCSWVCGRLVLLVSVGLDVMVVC